MRRGIPIGAEKMHSMTRGMSANSNQTIKRHGEKSRQSSCAFAESVAKVAIETFERLREKTERKYNLSAETTTAPLRTVMSAFIALDARTNAMTCLTLANGTKTISDEEFDREMEKKSHERGKLRDLHAEVLARRALKRYLALEMKALVSSEGCEDDEDSFLLERIENTADDGKDSGSDRILFRMKAHKSIHLYVSSCPCGNATIRKWAKGGMDDGNGDKLGPFTIPAQTHETPFLPLDVQRGSVAVALKKATTSSMTARSDEDDDVMVAAAAVNALHENGTLANGTVPVGENRVGRMCTCSDKIALWNVVGVQGSLLSTKLIEPIFIQSITIGRKFAYKHCARAFCCRVSKVFPSVNHPVLMQCERKFDLSPIDTTSAVVFDNPNSLIWTVGEDEVIEVCDGKTGQREGSSSRYCSSAFESLFFDTFRESSHCADLNIEEQMKEFAAMNGTIQDYDTAKETLFAKSFLPRSEEQTRRRRANARKMYYSSTRI